MYVPGKLNDVDHVLVDVGTGYFVEKVSQDFAHLDNSLKTFPNKCHFFFLSFQNVEDGKEFFKRKIDFLTKQIEKIQPALQEKHAMKQGDFTSIFYFSQNPCTNNKCI